MFSRSSSNTYSPRLDVGPSHLHNSTQSLKAWNETCRTASIETLPVRRSPRALQIAQIEAETETEPDCDDEVENAPIKSVVFAITALEGKDLDEAVLMGEQMAKDLMKGMHEDQIPIWAVWNYFELENSIAEKMMEDEYEDATKRASFLYSQILKQAEPKKSSIGKLFKSVFGQVAAPGDLKMDFDDAKVNQEIIGGHWDLVSLYYETGRKELDRLMFDSAKKITLYSLDGKKAYLQEKPLPPLPKSYSQDSLVTAVFPVIEPKDLPPWLKVAPKKPAKLCPYAELYRDISD